MGPKFNDKCPFKRQETTRVDLERRGEGHVKTEAEITPPEARRDEEPSPSETSEEA